MKRILLLDMDGPLAGFDDALWKFCQSFEIDLDISDLNDPNRKYYMTENVIREKDRQMLRIIIDKSNFFRNLPVTEGAQDGVQELVKHFDVWVCTKPLDTNVTCRNDKMAWIEKHFPDLYTKVIMAPKKSMVDGDILLDDAPALSCIETAMWKPVIFTDAFNGANSEWAPYPHWSWNDPIDLLTEYAEYL